MSARTVAGLRLHREPGTWWLTDDGRGEVHRARAIETCDGPHPERYRDPVTGRMATGYCYGGGEHDHEIGWSWQLDGRDADDVYSSFVDAATALARKIGGTR